MTELSADNSAREFALTVINQKSRQKGGMKLLLLFFSIYSYLLQGNLFAGSIPLNLVVGLSIKSFSVNHQMFIVYELELSSKRNLPSLVLDLFAVLYEKDIDIVFNATLMNFAPVLSKPF